MESLYSFGPVYTVPKQAAHPALAGSRDLQAFLEANEEEWGLEMSRSSHDGSSSMHSSSGGGGGGNAAQKAMASTLQKLKNLGHQTQSLVSGKHADEEEDPEYLKASLYTRSPRASVVGSLQHSADAYTLPSCIVRVQPLQRLAIPWRFFETSALRRPSLWCQDLKGSCMFACGRCASTCSSWRGTWRRRTDRRSA